MFEHHRVECVLLEYVDGSTCGGSGGEAGDVGGWKLCMWTSEGTIIRSQTRPSRNQIGTHGIASPSSHFVSAMVHVCELVVGIIILLFTSSLL